MFWQCFQEPCAISFALIDSRSCLPSSWHHQHWLCPYSVATKLWKHSLSASLATILHVLTWIVWTPQTRILVCPPSLQILTCRCLNCSFLGFAILFHCDFTIWRSKEDCWCLQISMVSEETRIFLVWCNMTKYFRNVPRKVMTHKLMTTYRWTVLCYCDQWGHGFSWKR